MPAAMRDRRIHPATRTFQAIRIHVNGELEGLQDAIEGAGLCLNSNGRMAVLSYHSGEDRAVKRAFKALAQTGEFTLLVKKPLAPGAQEQRDNPKSRSAKLRLIERKPRKKRGWSETIRTADWTGDLASSDSSPGLAPEATSCAASGGVPWVGSVRGRCCIEVPPGRVVRPGSSSS